LFGSLVTLELTVLIIDKHHIWPLGTSLTSSNRIEIKLEKPKVELPLKSLEDAVGREKIKKRSVSAVPRINEI